jgi:site-specific recombinase
LLVDTDPIHSLAIFYAAIAGVCLFLSGLIAGHHDNMAVYNKIPQRIRQLRWLEHLRGRPGFRVWRTMWKTISGRWRAISTSAACWAA